MPAPATSAVIRAGSRPLAGVPGALRAALIISVALQLCWGCFKPEHEAAAQRLPAPPDIRLLRLASIGEAGTTARVLMLWLQAFDDQSGASIPLAELDYGRVIGWLHTLLRLDSRFQYPLLAASRVYTQTPSESGKRQMLQFVQQRFPEHPEWRWPWMVQAVHVARHQLRDPQLALEYAMALRLNLNGVNAPAWASQLELFVLTPQQRADNYP